MSDGLCLDDLDEFGRELYDPLEELVQDVVHMLLEPWGSNIDAPSRGCGLGAALSGSAKNLPRMQSLIAHQLQQDDRISDATVDIQPTGDRGSWSVKLVLQLHTETLNIALVVDSAGGVRRA